MARRTIRTTRGKRVRVVAPGSFAGKSHEIAAPARTVGTEPPDRFTLPREAALRIGRRLMEDNAEVLRRLA